MRMMSGAASWISRTTRRPRLEEANMRTVILIASLFVAATAFAQTYDTVVQGGRVLDPETGVDAIRNVGITQGKVTRISSEPLTGKRVLDAKGLIVAPG